MVFFYITIQYRISTVTVLEPNSSNSDHGLDFDISFIMSESIQSIKLKKV